MREREKNMNFVLSSSMYTLQCHMSPIYIGHKSCNLYGFINSKYQMSQMLNLMIYSMISHDFIIIRLA